MFLLYRSAMVEFLDDVMVVNTMHRFSAYNGRRCCVGLVVRGKVRMCSGAESHDG